jgi:malonyl-CoA O-methyltransferase
MLSPIKKKIADAFDKGAPNYDWAALTQREVAEKLINFLPDKAPRNILEIGCGTGFLTKMLLQKYPQTQLTAIDISEKMIEKCKSKFPFITFEKADGETYEPAEKFDLIISNMSVQWFENPNEGLHRLKDFLNPNGTLLFSTLGKNNFKEWKQVLKELDISNNDKNPNYDFIIDEENKHSMYQDAFDFVKNLKEIGAYHSDQKPLSPRQLKQACAYLKDKHCCSMTWHILYGRFTQPGESASA